MILKYILWALQFSVVLLQKKDSKFSWDFILKDSKDSSDIVLKNSKRNVGLVA